MKSVYFHTDEAVHKKFKMMCAIKGDNMGKILTGLMQNYVAENKGLIDNPEIQENLPPELPEFYESQDKWSAYVRKSNKERKYVTSFTIDKKILIEFEKSIPLYSKSLTIEQLIKDFLEKRKKC